LMTRKPIAAKIGVIAPFRVRCDISPSPACLLRR
jgi:hypothetical protein